MTARWKTGLWLGKAWNSDEHLIAGEHGTVVVARSVKPDPNQVLTLEMILRVTGRVHSPMVSWTQASDRLNRRGPEEQEEDRSEAPEPEETKDEAGTPASARRRFSALSESNPALLRQWKVTKPMLENMDTLLDAESVRCYKDASLV